MSYASKTPKFTDMSVAYVLVTGRQAINQSYLDIAGNATIASVSGAAAGIMRLGATPTGQSLILYKPGGLGTGVQLSTSSITSGIKQFVFPDISGTDDLVTIAHAQTLSSKTLDSCDAITLFRLLNQGSIRFREGTGGGTMEITLQGPATLAANYTLTLPLTQSSGTQALVNNGAGVLSWANIATPPAAGIVYSNGTTLQRIAFAANALYGANNAATALEVKPGSATAAGAWTFGDAASTSQHLMNGQLRLFETAGNSANLSFRSNAGGSDQALVGVAGATNAGIVGSAVGDLFFRAASTNILFSADDGTTIHGKATSAGAWTFGAAGTALNLSVNGIGLFLSTGTGQVTIRGGTTSDGQLQLDYNGGSSTWRVINAANVFKIQDAGTGNFVFTSTSTSGITLGQISTAPSNGIDIYGQIQQLYAGVSLVLGSTQTTGVARQIVRFRLGGTTPANGTNCGGIQTTDGAASPAFYTGSSDERLKEGIVDAPVGALARLSQIRLRDFWLLGQTDGEKIRGVVAQELQPVYPGHVHEREDGYYNVSLGFDWEFVGAIQELLTKIEGLEARIEELEGS